MRLVLTTWNLFCLAAVAGFGLRIGVLFLEIVQDIAKTVAKGARWLWGKYRP